MDDDETLEPGGVELNINEENWFGQIMEQAMGLNEDEPSLTEALGGDESTAWSDVINVELTQMEKVNAWVPVIAPSNANIIPSHYTFRRK